MKTKEEVESSPIFRIVKKALMRKYPWIKNIYVGDEDNIAKYSSMLFVDMDIDAEQMIEQYGWKLEPWVKVNYMNKGYYDTVYLTTMVTKDKYDEARDLQNDIDAEMKRIQRSDAIPSEFKMDKTLGISTIRYYYPTQPDNTTITN